MKIILRKSNSQRSLSTALSRFFNIAHSLGYSPYKYDTHDGQLKFDESPSCRWYFVSNMCLLAAYELLLIARYLEVLPNKSASMKDQLTGAFFPFLYICLNLDHFYSWKYWGTLHVLFNQSVETSKNIQDAANLHGFNKTLESFDSYTSRKSRRFINTMLFILSAACILRGGKVLASPGSRELFSSIWTDIYPGTTMPAWIRLLFAVLQINVTGFHSYGVAFHSITFALNGVRTTATLNLLSIQKTSKHSISQTPSALSMLSHSYHLLAVMSEAVNQIYNMWPLMFELCFLLMVIVRLFLAIIHHDVMNYVGGLSALFGLLLLFSYFGETNFSCERTLSTWAAISHPWFSRYKKSIRPIRISVGGFFYVDKAMIMTIISIIINNLTSLLVAYEP